MVTAISDIIRYHLKSKVTIRVLDNNRGYVRRGEIREEAETIIAEILD